MGKIIGIIVVIAVLIWGGVYFSKDNDDGAMMKSGEESEVVSEGMMVPGEEGTDMMVEDEGMMSAGSYESYAPEKLAKAESGDVVLFFRAGWCPTCRALDADIKANLSKIPESLTILDVDYDNSNDLKKKYGVTYQHTFVKVDKDGKMLKKWSGSPTLSALVSEVK